MQHRTERVSASKDSPYLPAHPPPDMKDAPDVQAKEVPLQDLAVRFSCATRELQFLGLIKEASRSRRDGTVQRLAYPMRVRSA